MRFCFWSFYLLCLINHLSIFRKYHTDLIALKYILISDCINLLTLFFFKIALAILDHLHFQIIELAFNFHRKSSWDFDRICINYIHQIEKNWYLKNNESSNQWTCYILHVFRSSYIVILAVVFVFGVEILCAFCLIYVLYVFIYVIYV